MSKKNDRAWFVCRQWPDLVSKQYSSDAEAGQALKASSRVLAKLRSGTPVAKFTLLKALRRYAHRHDPGLRIVDMVIDTRKT